MAKDRHPLLRQGDWKPLPLKKTAGGIIIPTLQSKTTARYSSSRVRVKKDEPLTVKPLTLYCMANGRYRNQDW